MVSGEPAAALEFVVVGAGAVQATDASAVVGETAVVAVALEELAEDDRPFDAHPLSVSSRHRPVTQNVKYFRIWK